MYLGAHGKDYGGFDDFDLSDEYIGPKGKLFMKVDIHILSIRI